VKLAAVSETHPLNTLVGNVQKCDLMHALVPDLPQQPRATNNK